MAIFNQIKSFLQLPKARSKALQAESKANQVRAISEKVAPKPAQPIQPLQSIAPKPAMQSIAPKPAMQSIAPKPAMQSIAPKPGAAAMGPVDAYKTTPAPTLATPAQNPPQNPPQNPQLEAIRKSLGGITEGLQNFSRNIPTNAPVSTPSVATPPDTLAPIENEIISSLAPTAEEQAARKKLADLMASKNLALIDQEGRPIPLQAVLGEQGRIERRAAVEQGTLQDQLANVQAERAAKLEGAKVRYDIGKSKIERSDTLAKDERERMRQEKADAESRRRFDLTYNQNERKDGFTLSPGQIRYDEQGKQIATGGVEVEKDSNPNRLLSVSEAKDLGVPYGTTAEQAYGRGVSGAPTAEQSKARQFATSAENADKVLAQLNYNPGLIEPALPNALKSSARQQFEQAARAFVNATLRRESGATITDDEFKNKYKELIPQAGDGQSVKNQKALARAAAVKSIKEAGGDDGGGITTPDGLRWRQLPDGSYEQITFNSVGNTTASIPRSSKLAYVNNNPGNLRFAGQQGSTRGEGGFAKFPSVAMGIKALENQIKLDASRGLTLAQFVSKYAPPTENNTNQYIRQIRKMVGASSNTPIKNIDTKGLVKAIALKESGTRI